MRRKPTPRQPPKTVREMALWRCKTHCMLGKEDIAKNADRPEALPRGEYALYLLLSAVADLAEALSHEQTTAPTKQEHRP